MVHLITFQFFSEDSEPDEKSEDDESEPFEPDPVSTTMPVKPTLPPCRTRFWFLNAL